MADGGFAIACVVILCFVLFILYGRSTPGKTALHKVYGAPLPPRKPVRRAASTRKPKPVANKAAIPGKPKTASGKTTARK